MTPSVLRKHAQMLADAGVDAIIFDVTNQATYKPYYMALLRVFSEVRKSGGDTPQVAFLCPFWDPPRVVAELYKDLYEPGLYPDLWFRWDGKPLILADPELLGRTEGVATSNEPAELQGGHTLGQSFVAAEPVQSVGGCFPNWATHGAGMTLSLYRGGPKGEKIASQRFENVADCEWHHSASTVLWPRAPTTWKCPSRRARSAGGVRATIRSHGAKRLPTARRCRGIARCASCTATSGRRGDPAVLHLPHAAARLLPRADPARHVELAGSLPAARLPQLPRREGTNVGRRGPERRGQSAGHDV